MGHDGLQLYEVTHYNLDVIISVKFELRTMKHLLIFFNDAVFVQRRKLTIKQQPHHLCRCRQRIVSNKGRHQYIGVNYSVYHAFLPFLLRISSLAARISSLISSNESSGSLLNSATLLCCINKSNALGEPLIAKGMLRLLITALTKILNACRLCHIILLFAYNMIALCHHFDGKYKKNF